MTGHGNPSHWSGATTAPKLKRRWCRFKCGVHVDALKTEHGLVVQLETGPPPIDRNLSGMHDRVYEYRGPRVGWVPKFDPSNRTWRELRIVHECANHTPILANG